MLVTINWLKEFVDFDMSINEFADKITMLGLEVIGITKVGVFEENKSNIFMTKVLSCEKHPKANKLSICKIKADGKKYQVITNSPNINKGDFVVFAMPGTTLENGIEIGERKLKGENSEGMLLAKESLNIEEKSSDIWILGNNEKIAKGKYAIYAQPDYVLELDLTANRSDCLSIIGVAREVCALVGKELSVPKPLIEETFDGEPDIEIKNKNLCPRYAARIVKGIQIGESPDWMKRRLELCGIRAINNIVDATNYVLLEMGHPTHAFDLDRLDGQKIVVRKAKPDETITTLDGNEHKLSNDMLVIGDKTKAVALAGVMGGGNSEILDNSNALLVESAFFDPISIRKTAKQLGVRTESSYRFERTADWAIPPVAMDRVVELILLTSEGDVSRAVDHYVNIFKDKIVNIKESFVVNKLGINISLGNIEDYLKRLGFAIMAKRDGELEAKIPPFRSDIYRPIDLVEEIARVYGYNQIPATEFRPKTDTESLLHGTDIKASLRAILQGIGFTEIYNFGFTNKTELEKFRISVENIVSLNNPITPDNAILRNRLFHNMVKTIEYNNTTAYKYDTQFFEIGSVFANNKGLNEKEKLGLAISNKSFSYADAFGIVEYILKKLDVKEFEASNSEYNFLHPVNATVIKYNGELLGFVGELHPDIAETLDNKYPIFIAELDTKLLKSIADAPTQIKMVAKIPPSLRDLSIVVDDSVQARDVMNMITKSNDLIKQVNFVDVFKGKQLEKGKKSLTFSVLFQHPEKTMTDDEVTAIVDKLLKKLEKTYKAELRG
jgi:phenylalanyl-tRNA synthetase beta chain